MITYPNQCSVNLIIKLNQVNLFALLLMIIKIDHQYEDPIVQSELVLLRSLSLLY